MYAKRAHPPLPMSCSSASSGTREDLQSLHDESSGDMILSLGDPLPTQSIPTCAGLGGTRRTGYVTIRLSHNFGEVGLRCYSASNTERRYHYRYEP